MNFERGLNKPLEAKSEKQEVFKLDYKPFDPEAELKKISKLPKAEKKEVLEKYKEELISQKEGIAKLEEELEGEIRKNPDESADKYFKIVQEKAKDLKLSENQLSLFKKVLEEYQKRHKTIEETLKEYKDPKELFKACFGGEPEGKVEIKKTPTMIYFRCYNIKDYALLYSLKFLKTLIKDVKLKDLKISKKDIDKAKVYQGVVINKALLPKLNNYIAIENVSNPSRLQSPLLHEEQHIINQLIFVEREKLKLADALFLKKFVEENLRGPNPLKNIPLVAKRLHVSQKELLQKLKSKEFLKFLEKVMAEKYLNSFEKLNELRAKDEILAHYKGGGKIEHIFFSMISKSPHNFYNYFSAPIKNKLLEDLKRIFKLTNERFLKLKIVEMENKYRKNLDKAMGALNFLQEKGLKRNEIIRLLILEPLNSWFKLVIRMEKVKIDKERKRNKTS